MASLADLLNAQYDATQEYCNAQTALRNALQRDPTSKDDNSPTVVQATLQYETALINLQDCTRAVDDEYQQIQAEKTMRPSRLERLKQHMDRSRRIIRSLSVVPVVHENGVLQAQAVSVQDMTVALSAFRASIRTLE